MSDKPEHGPTRKPTRTLTEDDVVVRRTGHQRAIDQVGGARSPAAKIANDPHAAPKPQGGAPAGSDADEH